MRKVIFRAGPRWGSAINRGEEISQHLNSLGHKSEYFDNNTLSTLGISSLPNIENIKNSIVVYLKFPHEQEIMKLQENNNKIVLDVIDCIGNDKGGGKGNYTIEEVCENLEVLDGLILPTQDLKRKAEQLRPDMEIEVLYHHWDKQHLKNVENYKNDRDEFRLAYIGASGNLFFDEHIPNLTKVFEWEKMTSTSPYYTCHYSVRPENHLQFLYKPNTKISVAASVGSNAIHSKDLSLEGILSDDYPYLTDTDVESIKNTVKYAEETFGSKVWNDGLDMMREVKERTSIERVAGVDYVEFFERF